MTPSLKRQFKSDLYGQFALIGKALASGPRIELIELLSQGESSVEELADALGIPVANTSQHLQVLKRAGFVSVRRSRTYSFYRLSDSQVFKLWQTMRELGERKNAEIDRIVKTYLSDRETLEAIDAQELSRRLEEGSVTLIDVRPEKEYLSSHIVGALSIPVDQLETRLDEIPDHLSVVAYCRGPYCVYSDEAVRILSQKGFHAKRLSIGLPDWAAMDLAIEGTSNN